MGLDIRLPIGLMFTIFGILLTAFGLFGSRAIYERSLGININFGWGLVMLGFGIVMMALGVRRPRGAPAGGAGDRSEASPENEPPATRGRA
jgi:hypothetical protein